MKKPVIAALCCLLALGTATAAFAEEPTPTPAPELVELSPEETAPQFYPDSISWQEDGDQLLVVKQYSVPYGTAVTDLTESGMQWDGSDYTLWGVTQPEPQLFVPQVKAHHVLPGFAGSCAAQKFQRVKAVYMV